MRHTTTRAIFLVGTAGLALMILAGCSMPAETFDPVSSRGRSISDLFIVALILSAVVFVPLMGLLTYIVIRFRSRPDADEPRVVGQTGRWQAAWIGGMLLLFAVLGAFMIRTINIVDAPASSSAITIEVIGHQWWWEFRYPDSDVVTANELHVPVGKPLRLEIEGADVIHSFWVPEFGWKKDGIPGRTNTMAVEVDRPGVYDGACTEFCGAQHAWMRVRVVAEPEAAFDGWIDQQRQPAAEPPSEIARRGEDVFLANTCMSCHTVRFAAGSETPGGVGPDLTHFGSRETLGSGILPNTPENLRAWVQNADGVKPHVLMPGFEGLSDEEIEALVRYLEGLE